MSTFNEEHAVSTGDSVVPFDWQGNMPIPKEDQTVFRRTIVDRLRNGQPFDVLQDTANGDAFLTLSATHFVLNKLCEQEGINPKQMKIRLFDPESKGGPDDFFNITAFRNKLHFSHWDYDLANPKLPRSKYARECYLLAEDLGIPLTEEDYMQVPGLVQTDKGPLSTYEGDAKLINEGQKLISDLREKAHGGRIVVIGQAGSFAEKRYSDAQIIQIAGAIKRADKDAYIIVLSDKHFLKRELSPDYKAPYRAFPIQTRFPTEDPHFRQETDTELNNQNVDEVIFPTSMKDALRYFYAADTNVMTDCFWAHTGAAANALKNNGQLLEDSFFVLFTLADPKAWGITGAENIQSLSSEVMFGDKSKPKSIRSETVMDYNHYYKSIGEKNPPGVDQNPNDPRRGIRQQDLDLLLRNLTKKLTQIK